MAVCMHCGLARRSDDPEPEDDNPTATLMECGICWEICHPACLRETFEKVETDGIINEDLPSSWECIKCVNVGKQGLLKVSAGLWREGDGGWGEREYVCMRDKERERGEEGEVRVCVCVCLAL